MSIEERSSRGRSLENFKATQHLGMGVVYVIVGCLVFYVKYFGTIELSTGLSYAVGSLLILFGVFRVWRGIREMQAKRKRH